MGRCRSHHVDVRAAGRSSDISTCGSPEPGSVTLRSNVCSLAFAYMFLIPCLIRCSRGPGFGVAKFIYVHALVIKPSGVRAILRKRHQASLIKQT